MMKKYFAFVVIGFLIFGLGACVKHKPAKPAPMVYANWHIEKKTLVEKNEHPQYLIKAKYPEIVSHPGTASAEKLNQLIRDFVTSKMQKFKDTAPRDRALIDDYPADLLKSEFHITYTADFIRPRQHTLVSIRLETDKHYIGEPHHEHRFAVINYDLNRGEVVTLESLFKPGSDYLDLLSTTCQKELISRLTEGMTWAPWDFEGSQPKAENFKLWNLDRKGLLITFQEYQVTPYSSEPQVIIIPYPALRPVLAENSPIAVYAYR